MQRWIGVFIVGLGLLTQTHATAELAAVMTVRTSGVEVLRAGTDRWLGVSAGAVMPIGSGDRVRTSETGRVELDFDAGIMLLLPESELHLIAYTVAAQEVQVEAALVGVLVQRWARPPSAYALRLEGATYTLSAPGAHSAVWALPNLPDSVAVAEGDALVTGRGAARVAAGQMAWLEDAPQVVSLAEPLNTARLEGALFGCAGFVQTEQGQNLLVRRGIGTGFQALGFIPNREPIAAMAVNQSGGWVRIQFRNHFGWVLRLALEIDCPDLPRLPDSTTQERLYNVIEVTPEEVALLRPFYGEPRDDPFFYVR